MQVETCRAHPVGKEGQFHLAGAGELDRVVHQVDEHLAEAARVAAQLRRQLWVDAAADVDGSMGEARADEGAHLAGDGLRGEGDLLEVEPAGLDLGKVENVVEQGEQRVGAGPDGAGKGLLLAVQIGFQEQVGEAEDGVHRCADLVAHDGEEGALGSVGCLRGALGGAQLLGLSADLLLQGGRVAALLFGQPAVALLVFGEDVLVLALQHSGLPFALLFVDAQPLGKGRGVAAGKKEADSEAGQLRRPVARLNRGARCGRGQHLAAEFGHGQNRAGPPVRRLDRVRACLADRRHEARRLVLVQGKGGGGGVLAGRSSAGEDEQTGFPLQMLAQGDQLGAGVGKVGEQGGERHGEGLRRRRPAGSVPSRPAGPRPRPGTPRHWPGCGPPVRARGWPTARP